MKSIIWHLKIYFLLTAQYLKTRMEYRADFFVSMLGIFVTSVVRIITTWLIFQSIPSLKGWTFNEIIFFLGFFQTAMLPYTLFFQSFWGLANDVRSGNFIRYYFRPLNTMFYYVARGMDWPGSLFCIVIAVVILAYGGIHLAVHWTVWKVLLFIVNWFSSALIIISILVGGMTAAFWIINPGSLTVTLSAVRDHSQYPLTIFSKGFRVLFTFFIPIGFISFYPCLPLLRPVSEVPLAAWFSPAVGPVIFFLVYQLWKKGINHYSGTGS